MEPVTHLLTGACLSRVGLNRKTAYATLTMVVAAEFPDIDTLWSLRGSAAGFEHHRGITHTFVGLPFEAAFLVALVYGVDRGRRHWRAGQVAPLAPPDSRAVSRPAKSKRAETAVPIRWGWLYLLALLALLSHLLLDYTNNYGLRPFYPFDPHWYAASIVFIFDPLMFAMLLAGLAGPALFGLVGSEVGAQRQPFRGRGWSIAALTGVVALWGLREVEHTRALRLALAQSIARPAQEVLATSQDSSAPPGNTTTDAGSLQPGQQSAPAPPVPPVVYLVAQRALASPHPLNPFAWSLVTDFGTVYQLAEASTRDATVQPSESLEPKPNQSAAVQAAEASPLGRFYTNWSPMPFVSVSSPSRDSEGDLGSANTAVTFRDPRFMGEVPMLHNRLESPLSATVTLNTAGRVVRQSMGTEAAQ
jgi:inner membrane protein